MIYRNDPYLDAQFQKAVQAAHDQDWDTFERSSFYDARMMEDLLYVCEDFMPLEAKCRFALEHYDNHGDHSPIIRKYVRRARIIRPENWRDALPESVRDLDILRSTVALAATSAARLSRSRGHSLTMLQSGSHVAIIFFTNCPSMFIRPRSKPIKSSRISITATSSRFCSIATSRMCRRSHPCEGTALYTTHS